MTRNKKNKETAYPQTRSMDKSRSRSLSHETKRSKSSESKSKDSPKRRKGSEYTIDFCVFLFKIEKNKVYQYGISVSILTQIKI